MAWKRIVSLFGALALCAQLVAASDVEYVVKRGETVYGIAREYGIPVDVLLSYNSIRNARDLRVGAVLKIPAVYRVKRGDTLYGIARDHHLTLDTLLALNHFDARHVLTPGELLVLPYAPETSSGDAAIARNDANANPGADPSRGPSGDQSQGIVSDATAQTGSSASGTAVEYFWPHPGQRVLLTGKLAGGAQISGKEGDPVYSVSTGRVVWVGPYRGYGRVVFVESPENLIYVYGGNERTLVRVGEQIHPGVEVALMGMNPRIGQACIFFFIYRDGKALDADTAPRG